MYLLLALVLFLVAAYYLSPPARNRSSSSKGHSGTAQQKRARPADPEKASNKGLSDRGELIRCSHCSTFFPPRTAVRHGSGNHELMFCSQQCKDQHRVG